jgi:hypothetical protein
LLLDDQIIKKHTWQKWSPRREFKMKKSESINFISVLIWFCLVFILGSESQAEMQDRTVEQAMNLITEAFHKQVNGQELQKVLQRQITFSVADWRSELTQFVRVEKDNIPILGEPILTASTIDVIGLTKSGEILQFVDKRETIKIRNPLGWEGVDSGVWYKVKLLDGKEGWIFAKPTYQSSLLATYFERNVIKQPQMQEGKKTIKQPQKQEHGAVYLIVIVATVAIILFFKSFGDRKTSSSSYSGGDGGTPSVTEKREKTEWPWRGNEVVVGQKNIYEKGFFSDAKVGHVEKNICGGKELYKEGLIFSEKIGKVEENFWGTPKAIVDKGGNKVGDIKTTWTGRQIIVDENGKEIGEYKND